MQVTVLLSDVCFALTIFLTWLRKAYYIQLHDNYHRYYIYINYRFKKYIIQYVLICQVKSIHAHGDFNNILRHICWWILKSECF
jgi:hypothetical protein